LRVMFMTRVDPLADALNAIKNAEMAGKREITMYPASKILLRVLEIIQKHGYINEFELIDDGREGMVRVVLAGAITKCGAIRPRYAVQKDGWTEWEKQFLPARGIGILIVSTPEGLMTHEDAKQRGLGGRLIAYVY